MPFKANAQRRHHIPRQKHKVTNWRDYDASLRQRGSLTVWFTDEAIAAWRATPRTTQGGQQHYSSLAILTALTLRTVFRLALRQTKGLISSVIRLLGLDPAVPDHPTLSRRAETLELPRLRSSTGAESVPLLVDSTGLKLCGPGEWLLEKHGTKTCRAWRKLHLGVDARSGPILASMLTGHDADDAAQVRPLLDQVVDPLASFTGDGAYEQEGLSAHVAERHLEAAFMVVSETAATASAQRDRHLEYIAAHGRTGWQKASGYTVRTKAETAMSRFKQIIGDALRSRMDKRWAIEVAVAVRALNRMLDFGRPISVRLAW